MSWMDCKQTSDFLALVLFPVSVKPWSETITSGTWSGQYLGGQRASPEGLGAQRGQ